MTTTSTSDLPVAVIGAGPIGLAAAAHLADRSLPFVVLEAGDSVGAAVQSWGHIRTFTPWRYIVDTAAEKVLATSGWARPTTPVPPNGSELVTEYLIPLASALGDPVLVGHRVLAVTREGADKAKTVGRSGRPFLLRVQTPGGDVTEFRARAVIDASGTWSRPNPLGSAGLPARGEEAAGAFLVGPLPDVLGRDRDRFAGRRTLVIGAGHSAANTLLNLAALAEAEPGTRILWAIRGADPSKVYGGQEADQLPARGQLGSDLRRLVDNGVLELVPGFSTTALEVDGATVTVVGTTPSGERRIAGVDNVAAATGFRPDLDLLSEVRLDLDPGLEAPRLLAPLIDPAYHSCGTVPPHGHRDLVQPDEGLYIVGMKSYGRAPTFLITTGNEQVRSVVAAIAGDLAAADEIQLVLPETGVCSVNAKGEDVADAGGCCGTSTGDAELTVPDEAHRARPENLAAQGFSTGVRGGGTVAAAVLADSTGGGCCAG